MALATASRALTTLSRDGFLRAQPRVRYIVAPATPEPPSERGGPLTRDRIVRAAIAIADAEGLSSLSMRGVASKLAVPTMSLYRHVQSRAELLLMMADGAFAERALPPREGRGWRELLELAARVQWALYQRHPWLPQIMSLTRPMILEHVVQYADWTLAAMDGVPIDAATKMYVHMTLYSYVRGVAVNLESERQAEAETDLTEQEWMDA